MSAVKRVRIQKEKEAPRPRIEEVPASDLFERSARSRSQSLRLLRGLEELLGELDEVLALADG